MHTAHGWLSEKQSKSAVDGLEGNTCFKLSMRQQKSFCLIAEHREDLGESATSKQHILLKLKRTENTFGKNICKFNVRNQQEGHALHKYIFTYVHTKYLH